MIVFNTGKDIVFHMRLGNVPFVIGGSDPRNVCLARLLIKDGFQTLLWDAPPQADIPAADDALFEAPCVLVIELYTQGDALWQILGRLHRGSVCFGGRASEAHLQYAAERGILYFDMLQQEAFCIQNSIPTAEGALMAAMQNTPYTIHGSRMTVLGYGRIGKAVANIFKACSCNVSVVSREREELAYAQASGHRPMHLTELPGALQDADIIINTIPARLLDAAMLGRIRTGTLILELASGMENIDLTAAKARGLNVVRAGSLPGKVAPASAAQYFKDAMLYCLKNWGELKIE